MPGEMRVTVRVKDASMRRRRTSRSRQPGSRTAWRGRTLVLFGRRRGGSSERGAPHMADLAYAVLLTGAFVLLALMVRGMERL
jgi:hypothetical protein